MDEFEKALSEIKDAALTPGEDEELIRKYRFAENSRRIIEIASGASQALANADHSLLDQVGDVLRTLRELETLDPDEGPQFPEQLLNVYEQLQTLATNLADYAANVPQVRQLIDLALLGNGLLRGRQLSDFIARSVSLIK